MTAMRGRPTTVEEVVAWLRTIPAPERERVAQMLCDPATVGAIKLERARAVVEMLDEPGASWESVAARMGVGVSVISRMRTAANKARAAEG